jgi:formiminotetrahydrofolate cyclodeaminase
MSHYKMTKEAEEEKEHFKKVLQAFGNYKRDSKERLQRSHVHLKNIPLEHQKILAKHSHLQSLQQLDSCVELNRLASPGSLQLNQV